MAFHFQPPEKKRSLDEESKTSIAKHLTIARSNVPVRYGVDATMLRAVWESIVPLVNFALKGMNFVRRNGWPFQYSAIQAVCHAVIAGLLYQARIDGRSVCLCRPSSR
jgi:hypothetical protein